MLFWRLWVKFVSPGCEGVALCIQECRPCVIVYSGMGAWKCVKHEKVHSHSVPFCIYIYIYIYIFTYIYINYTNIYRYTHIYIYTYTCLYIYIYMYISLQIYIFYIYIYINYTDIYRYIHIYIYVYVHICIRICITLSLFAEGGGSKNGPKQAIDLLVLMDDASLPADRVVCSAACLRSIGFRDSGLKGSGLRV